MVQRHGEIRVDWGPGYCVYLAKDGEALILLFCGGPQKRQQADVETALALHAEYKKRKKGATKRRDDHVGLTRDFRQTICERVRRDRRFARSLLDEAATLFLNGEPEAPRLLLRDLVNATLRFETLSELTNKPAKSLHNSALCIHDMPE